MRKTAKLILAFIMSFALSISNLPIKANDSNSTIDTRAVIITDTLTGTDRYVKSISTSHYITFKIDVEANVTKSGSMISTLNSVSADVTQYDNNGVYASSLNVSSVTGTKSTSYVNVTVKFTYDIMTESIGDYLYRDQTTTVTVKAQ